MKTSPSSTQSGVALIAIILSMLAVATIGVAVLSIATSSRHQRVAFGISNRAYYLAESGAEFVRAERLVNPNALPIGTFTLANGDQFAVTTFTNLNNELVVQSTGIANPGTSLESRQAVTFIIGSSQSFPPLELGFDNDGDGQIDSEWEFTAEGVGSDAQPVIAAPPEGGSALAMPNWMGNFNLNWSGNPNLDLVRAWNINSRLLSYDIQAKVSPAKSGMRRFADGTEVPIFNAAHLVGLTFRLQQDKLSSYGVSLWRNHPLGWTGTAPWRDALGLSFWQRSGSPDPLSNTNLFLVLWERQYPAPREVIAYKRLPPEYLHASPFRAGSVDMKPFTTILINLEEFYVGGDTNQRSNKITIYTQTTNVYQRWPDGIGNQTHAHWQDNTNIFPGPVTWDVPAGQTVITNNLFTSQLFDVIQPAEIGLHVYDYTVNYFDDFLMRVVGHLPPGRPGQIQF
ncbi:MAG TPA: hypothetical protein PKE55_11245 [Kiritimatiellia bacterium]|nr:hypothetical protein [Kiritimatiellia bacterium]